MSDPDSQSTPQSIKLAEQDIDDPLPLEEMRRRLMIAEEQVQQGLVSPLDMDAIIAEGHKILAARHAAKS